VIRVHYCTSLPLFFWEFGRPCQTNCPQANPRTLCVECRGISRKDQHNSRCLIAHPCRLEFYFHGSRAYSQHMFLLPFERPRVNTELLLLIENGLFSIGAWFSAVSLLSCAGTCLSHFTLPILAKGSPKSMHKWIYVAYHFLRPRPMYKDMLKQSSLRLYTTDLVDGRPDHLSSGLASTEARVAYGTYSHTYPEKCLAASIELLRRLFAWDTVA
jgi:hypothetical protein